jgi:cell division protein FtsB
MGSLLERVLNKPKTVFLLCFTLSLFSLLTDGTFNSWLRLKLKETELVERIEVLRRESVVLDEKIKSAHDPKYLEREARERFDLVREEDLVFVFSE